MEMKIGTWLKQHTDGAINFLRIDGIHVNATATVSKIVYKFGSFEVKKREIINQEHLLGIPWVDIEEETTKLNKLYNVGVENERLEEERMKVCKLDKKNRLEESYKRDIKFLPV